MSSTSTVPSAHAGHVAQHGVAADYRIELDSSLIPPGSPHVVTFQIIDPDGAIVTEFEDRHERPMHLIVVSDDLIDYAHLHPRLAPDGTWSVDLPAFAAGGHRIIADAVAAGGPDLVLTLDLVVPGSVSERPLPDPAGSTVVDGHQIVLDLVRSPHAVTADFTVRRDGAVVDPEPYLGARGHLVAIDVDDLAYLHVHPAAGDGAVSFTIADPSPGRYRLFFDFSIDGRVRTAAFTVDIDDDTSSRTEAPAHGHGRAAGEALP